MEPTHASSARCNINTAVSLAEIHFSDIQGSPICRTLFERGSYAPTDRGTGSMKGSEHEIENEPRDNGSRCICNGDRIIVYGVVPGAPSPVGRNQIRHVLLISVDGMHQSDLDWYVSNHPNSELARLATGGAEYTDAQTSDPSDSDPGGSAIMTGGNPKVTGIYYDDEYSHDVLPPGTTNCSGPVPGGDVIYDLPDDKLPAVPDLLNNGSGNTFPSFDEGGSIYPNGIDTNPSLIMNLSPHPQSGLNPATYPVDPKTCQPIQPWDYVGVDTIFQVIHNAGMRTAWSDKHAIYTSFNGPGSGGTSIDDFFGPEIDSQAVEPNGVPYPVDGAWTDNNAGRPNSTTLTRSRQSSIGSTVTTTPVQGPSSALLRSTA